MLRTRLNCKTSQAIRIFHFPHTVDRIFALFGWAVFTLMAQFLLIPRFLGWPPRLLSILSSICLYLVLAWFIRSFLHSLKVWRSSLASRYEQQCQKTLHAFNLQLCDGSSVQIVRPTTPVQTMGGTIGEQPNNSTINNVKGSIDHAVKHPASAGYHLAFVRRMPRRLVAFIEAYREEYRARRRYCLYPSKSKAR